MTYGTGVAVGFNGDVEMTDHLPQVPRERTRHVHNPRYDFNGDALAIGASYAVMLAEPQLPASGSRPPS